MLPSALLGSRTPGPRPLAYLLFEGKNKVFIIFQALPVQGILAPSHGHDLRGHSDPSFPEEVEMSGVNCLRSEV